MPASRTLPWKVYLAGTLIGGLSPLLGASLLLGSGRYLPGELVIGGAFAVALVLPLLPAVVWRGLALHQRVGPAVCGVLAALVGIFVIASLVEMAHQAH